LYHSFGFEFQVIRFRHPKLTGYDNLPPFFHARTCQPQVTLKRPNPKRANLCFAMKKFLLFFPAVFLFTWADLSAQTVPNGDFENWTQQFYFSEPDFFWTTNVQAYFSGAGANVTKSTDAYAGTYALKLEAVAVDTSVAPGAIGLGTPGPSGFVGGYPYTELPDTLTGYAKYNIAPGDTAFMLVIFMAGGSPFSVASQPFTGVQDAYAQFKLPITTVLPVEPDTFQFFLATSANFDSAVAGNVLYMDGLSFIGASAPFPNGGFEDWTDVASEEPDGGWITSNIFNIGGAPSVTKTSDATSGNYAIRLENVPSFFGPPSSFALLGELGEEDPTGGFPLLNTPKMISGFYKYAPAGPDSSFFFAGFSKWNPVTSQTDSIAEVEFSMPPTAEYTLFELPFDVDWTAVPDTMLFGFAPSNVGEDSTIATLGSILQVDNLTIEFVSGVTFPLEEYLSLVKAFPNPARDFIALHFSVAESTPLQVVIYDGNGKERAFYDLGVQSGEVSFEVPVAGLPPGSYIYSIVTEKGPFHGKFIAW
jgi:Secretion system C-terminal sorting domain